MTDNQNKINEKKIQKPKRSNAKKLDNEYNVNKERTKLARSVTHLLIFVIVFNTIFTTIITFLIGLKLIVLSLETYVSYVASSISIIGVISLIVHLLPKKRDNDEMIQFREDLYFTCR